MKPSPGLRHPSRRLPAVHAGNFAPRGASGIALVVVLSMIVFLTVLVVAFLSSVSTERQSATSFASESNASGMADSAVNIVMAQIADATAKPTQAWASQPGMIRTYDNMGKKVTAYKLYSSANLRVDGDFDAKAQTATEVPPNWADASNANLYTDLNKPVKVGDITHYPIIDPRAVAKTLSGGVPLLTGETPVEGCFLDTNNAAVTTTATQPNPVPMPVQWMYVLKDGTVAPAKASGTGSSVQVGTTATDTPTAANPVVGRVAFWTDDETCKVNVNTASEGTFWDRPWTETKDLTTTVSDAGYERQLAYSMPVQNEFQRYPGHPAMTCLSTVFPRILSPASNAETDVQYKERVYKIIPRIGSGGSMEGTARVGTTSGTSAITLDGDRLFASVDEFLFQASSAPRKRNPAGGGSSTPFVQDDIEKTRFFLTTSSRSPEVNLFNKPRITLWPLQANTSDVTKPNDAFYRNAKDKLIAFCSTLGSGNSAKPYYFQRYNVWTTTEPKPSSQSPTADWDKVPRNQELYTYLQTLVSSKIPGLGGTLGGGTLGKYSAPVRDQILTEMFDFCRSEVNTFSTGGQPQYSYAPFNSSGFTMAQNQIVPLVIPTADTMPNGTKGFGRFSTVTQAAIVFYRKDDVTMSGPNVPGSTHTALVPTGGNELVIRNGDAGTLATFKYSYPSQTTASVGAVVLLQPFNPTPGQPLWSGNARYVVSGLDSFKVNGMPMGFGSKLANLVDSQDMGLNALAQTGFEANLRTQAGPGKKLGSSLPDNPDQLKYPFYADFTLSGPTAYPTSFLFSGGEIKIEIYSGYYPPGSTTTGPLDPKDLVQTIHMIFPPVTLPTPKTMFSAGIESRQLDPLPAPATQCAVISAIGYTGYWTDYNNRLNYHPPKTTTPTVTFSSRLGYADDAGHHPLPVVYHVAGTPPVDNIPVSDAGDSARSVEARWGGPALGDYRAIAALRDVPATFFEGHGMSSEGLPPDASATYKYDSTTFPRNHSLRVHMTGTGDTSASQGFYDGAGSDRTNDRRGKLLLDVNLRDPNRSASQPETRNSSMPIVPRGLYGAFMDGTGLSAHVNGDWDTGPGKHPDGPFINKADEANANNTSTTTLYYENGGYLSGGAIQESGMSFSPNRQISSAVSFGSLPTGIDPTAPAATKPWRTLLFCRNPAAGTLHPGFGLPKPPDLNYRPPFATPPDHAFLDFFTMPIVEPYAISEPFSTDGKVNMNYQMVPFTYLTRDTAVRAVMKSTNMMAIPQANTGTSSYSLYKLSESNQDAPDYRYKLNPDESTGTLRGFENRFTTGDIFRSASEICDIFLIPGTPVGNAAVPGPQAIYEAKPQSISMWWNSYQLTGDNVREQPYGHLYPRLTTKSNTFTVHLKVQSLKKSPHTPVAEFTEGKDQVTSEYRGAVTIQRYLDPNADTLVLADGKTPGIETDPNSMVGPYKFRVISNRRFAP